MTVPVPDYGTHCSDNSASPRDGPLRHIKMNASERAIAKLQDDFSNVFDVNVQIAQTIGMGPYRLHISEQPV